MNDLSKVLKVFLVTGDNANVGGGETSKSGKLIVGDGWDRANGSCCCPESRTVKEKVSSNRSVSWC